MKHVLAAATFLVLILAAYSNSFHSRFVVDNRFLILDDPRVHAATSDNIGLIFSHTYWWPTNEAALYRPFTTLSYLFNYAILGNADNPAGYHWINFLLHFFNVLLVYALSLRLLRKFWPAIFISALWAVHPVLTESVTNIVGRADLFASLGTLGGLLMYLKSTESSGWRRWTWLIPLFVVTLLGAFSKESAVAIVGVVVLYEITFWKDRKKYWQQMGGPIAACAAIVIPILAMLYERASVLSASQPPVFPYLDNPLRGAGFFQARITAVVVMAKYLWLLVWPANLSADYSYSQIPIASGTLHDWIAWIAVIAVMLAVAIQFTKNRVRFFFGVFAFMTFLPMANLLFQTGTIMAERFMYLPSIGLAGCVVMTVYAIGERIGVSRLASVLLCLCVAAFAGRTWARNVDWSTEISIARASLRTSPNSFKAHFDMAVQLSNSDPTGSNLSEVIEEIDKSMAILNPVPDVHSTATVYAEAGRDYLNKGNLQMRVGADGQPITPPGARRAYQKALQVLQKGVAIDQAVSTSYREEIRVAGKSAEIPLGFPKVYEEIAEANIRLGDFPHAYDAAAYASTLEPAKVQNYIFMGQARDAQGRHPEAALTFTEGLLASGNQSLLATLSELYKTGIDPEGCAFLQTPQGVLLNPKCAPVHRDLCGASVGLMKLYQQGRQEEIVRAIRSKAIEQFGCLPSEVQ